MNRNVVGPNESIKVGPKQVDKLKCPSTALMNNVE